MLDDALHILCPEREAESGDLPTSPVAAADDGEPAGHRGHAACPEREAESGDLPTSPVAAADDGEPAGSEASPPEPPPQVTATPPPARASTAHRLPPPVDAFLQRQRQQQLEQLADAKPPEPKQRAKGFVLFHAMPGWLFSAIVHLLAFLTLSVYAYPDPNRGAKFVSLRTVNAEDDTGVDSFVETILEAPPPPAEVPLEAAPNPVLLDAVALAAPEIDSPEVVVPEPEMPVPLPEAEIRTSSARLGSEPGFRVGDDARGGLAQRGDRRRQALALGATAESENAVELALQWLVRHQRLDGSWNFQQQLGEHHCPNCPCPNPGPYVDAENGATGMVLLALLGAGHTQLQGEYRDEVAAGLRCLIDRQESDGSLKTPRAACTAMGWRPWRCARPWP